MNAWAAARARIFHAPAADDAILMAHAAEKGRKDRRRLKFSVDFFRACVIINFATLSGRHGSIVPIAGARPTGREKEVSADEKRHTSRVLYVYGHVRLRRNVCHRVDAQEHQC